MCVVVMAMVGWMATGMELVLGKHAGQSQVVGRMSGDAGAFPECVGNTLITPDRTTIQVRSSGYGRAGNGRSSWKGLMAPVRCPCSRLAALHGAPRTQCDSCCICQKSTN